MYIPLHWHSTYSFLEALWSSQQIVNKAKEIWLPAIAITDYSGIYCFPSFYLAATAKKEETDPTIKPLIGVELGFVANYTNILGVKEIGTICLLALNNEGYNNLREIITFANEEGIERKPKIDPSILEKYKEGIIVFYGWVNSRCYQELQNGGTIENIKLMHAKLKEMFGDRCYLEITAQDETRIHEYKEINHIIYDLAKETQTECIVNNNYFYPDAKLREAWEVALCIKDGTKIYDKDRRNPQGAFHIMTEDEIKEICLKNGYSEEEINHRIQNNETIANQAEVTIPFGQALFPQYESPERVQELFEQFKDTMIVTEDESSEESH